MSDTRLGARYRTIQGRQSTAALLYGGISLIVNTVWPIVVLPAVLMVVHYGVISREERYLERKFGDVYQQYRARVRRWL